MQLDGDVSAHGGRCGAHSRRSWWGCFVWARRVLGCRGSLSAPLDVGSCRGTVGQFAASTDRGWTGVSGRCADPPINCTPDLALL